MMALEKSETNFSSPHPNSQYDVQTETVERREIIILHAISAIERIMALISDMLICSRHGKEGTNTETKIVVVTSFLDYNVTPDRETPSSLPPRVVYRRFGISFTEGGQWYPRHSLPRRHHPFPRLIFSAS
mmetsp:Transcript_5745/g.16405  ORF Transcript_5745/g.16405 Transcript_5745/m.16405 type:complete len:130 (+) Transcript_5745:1715-2104(+)